MSQLIMFDLDDVEYRRAVKAAARALRYPLQRQDGPTRFAVRVLGTDQAYALGLETMKRWRAALGRDPNLRWHR